MAKGKCRLAARWIIVSTLVLLTLLQGILLYLYFYNHYKQFNWLWFLVVYFAPIAVLLWQQIVETLAGDASHSTEQVLYGDNATSFEKSVKHVIGAYHKMFAWFLYVAPSIFQFVWILSAFAEEIETSSLLGPRFLTVILCIPSGVFLLLDTIEYAAKPELNVEWWRVFDLFDTVELLQILLVDNRNSLPINQATKTAMLLFGSLSLFFPAFSLWELHACRTIPSGARRPSCNARSRLISRVRIASKLCQLIFVNIAFLAIRLVLYWNFKLDASLFVAKNTVAIIVGGIEIFSACRTNEGNKPKERVTLRSTSQNPAFETELDGPHDTNSAECLNDNNNLAETEECSSNLSRRKLARNGDLAERPRATCDKDTKSYLSKLDDILLETHNSKVPLGVTITKPTESRSTQTTMVEIPNHQLDCQWCGSRRMPSLASEHLQIPRSENPVLSRDSIVSVPWNTDAKESSPLSSALQQTTIQDEFRSPMQIPRSKCEPRFCLPQDTNTKESDLLSSASQLKTSMQNKSPPKKTPVNNGNSRVRLPLDTGTSELSPLSSALQQQRTRKDEPCSPTQIPRSKFDPEAYSSGERSAMESNPFSLDSLPKTRKLGKSSPKQYPRRDNPDLSGVSRAPSPRDTGAKESNPLPLDSLPKTRRLGESSRKQYPRRGNPDLSGVLGAPSPRDTGAKESNPLPLTLRLKTSRQDESSQKQNSIPYSGFKDRLHPDTSAKESGPLPSALQKNTSRQGELSRIQNRRREKPGIGGEPRPYLPRNAHIKELNRYFPSSLDDISADYGTSEIQLSFSDLQSRPTRHLNRPFNQYASQRKRPEIKPTQRDDFPDYRPGRENRTPASTVWGTRN